MKRIIPLVAVLLLAAMFAPAMSEAACGRGKKLAKGAKQKAGAVLRFVLPPYGR